MLSADPDPVTLMISGALQLNSTAAPRPAPWPRCSCCSTSLSIDLQQPHQSQDLVVEFMALKHLAARKILEWHPGVDAIGFKGLAIDHEAQVSCIRNLPSGIGWLGAFCCPASW